MVLKALKLYVPGRLTSPTILTLKALGIPTEILTNVRFWLIPKYILFSLEISLVFASFKVNPFKFTGPTFSKIAYHLDLLLPDNNFQIDHKYL